MARKNKTRDYHEPWSAQASRAPRNPPNLPDGLPDDVKQQAIDAFHRVEENTPWVVWGSRMVEPGPVKSLMTGEVKTADDKHIVVVVYPVVGKKVSQAEIAQRIAECVTALARVDDPSLVMARTREMVVELIQQGVAHQHLVWLAERLGGEK